MYTLLRSLYDPSGKLPPVSETAQYQEALRQIEESGICCQVYSLLHSRNRLEEVPAFFRNRLQQVRSDSLYLNLYLGRSLQKLLQSLEERGIPAIPLKGVPFAERYFGGASARPTSDIDLLIQPVHLEAAEECVRSLGYDEEEERIPAHFHRSFSRRLPHTPVPLTVELHWGLLKENTSALTMDAFWAASEPYGKFRYIRRLSDYHEFYMIALHGWKHNLNSAKYLLDLVQLVHVLGDRLDYSRLLRDAAVDRTSRRLKWTLSVLYRQFPHLHAIQPLLWKLPERLYWEPEHGQHPPGAIGRYRNLLVTQHMLFDSFFHALPGAARWLFPSRVEAGFELEKGLTDSRHGSLIPLYLQRGRHLIRALSQGTKKVEK
ncbi:nucleotidyltransferase family protein [Paenibacillus aurantius]|uniref:Nucleotidyltransferase family protein n=1 Tax=Paenibacillus aurantius TaxID=2918900 RepID=A0AA96LHE1_9BACL|nr:nucleotidyltransferase family protein [Paenibacillus aurantius]WNQ14169.1 nucleotidyltransferase family protein [Paenibacillus aurantius]